MLLNYTEKSIERRKCYLKTKYQLYCSDPAMKIASHSEKFALSDSADTSLQSNTDISDDDCAECYELFKVIETFQDSSKNADADLEYDRYSSKGYLQLYEAPAERFTKNKVKVDAFVKLDENTGFCLKYFCQKVLPARFRESQKEYFGKKGISLHVHFIFEERRGISQTCLFHCNLQM